MTGLRSLSFYGGRPATLLSPPDPSLFLNPFNDSALLGYYHEIAKWHGFVRFIGLPQLKDNPDLPLASLYVKPSLTTKHVALQARSSNWQEVEEPLAALVAYPRLVVLGDPGSGKSTFVSWVALELTRSLSGLFQELLGPLVPLPMILRDLDLGSTPTWEDLLEAFLRHPIAHNLSESLVRDLFERGQAFPLLDGLDEIGSVSTRKALSSAIFQGFRQYPKCHFLLTSRIVGYERVPFHFEVFGADLDSTYKPISRAEVRYIAPFTTEQIQCFAQNWYAQREGSDVLREEGVRDLLSAIRGSETTLGLARNPILLTLMALVHRVERTLPHGRVLLFEKISSAYLETIDTFRGLKEGTNLSLAKKKRWLAEVAFEMQRQRLRGDSENEEGKQRESETGEILATEAEVLAWLGSAIHTSTVADPELAGRFLDYIGRRSGLLLPRGQGVFSFVHLSFQEYFAAWHIAETIATRAWLSGQAPPGLDRRDLALYANVPSFREVFVLLFELLADRGDWSEVMAEVVFGDCLEKVKIGGEEEEARAFLLAAVSVDPYMSWPRSLLNAAWRACWHWELLQQQARWPLGPLLVRFLFGGADAAAGWPALLDAAKNSPVESLSLHDAAVTDVAPIVVLRSLVRLDLSGTNITDVTPLGCLKSLQYLNLSETGTDHVAALAGLGSLQVLSLNGTGVSDVTPLAGLNSLTHLNLSRTQVTDITPIGGMTSLVRLDLSGTSVWDITPLAGLTKLGELDLVGTVVTDLTPLAGLENLKVIR